MTEKNDASVLKQEILENLYCELGEVMDCDDEAIAEQWAFELNI